MEVTLKAIMTSYQFSRLSGRIINQFAVCLLFVSLLAGSKMRLPC